MLIYNQRPHRSLSNFSRLEVHHIENTLEIFLKHYSNERQVKKKKNNVGDAFQINRASNIFEKGKNVVFSWKYHIYHTRNLIPQSPHL